jgi:hypothetical protein
VKELPFLSISCDYIPCWQSIWVYEPTRTILVRIATAQPQSNHSERKGDWVPSYNEMSSQALYALAFRHLLILSLSIARFPIHYTGEILWYGLFPVEDSLPISCGGSPSRCLARLDRSVLDIVAELEISGLLRILQD